MRGTALSSLLTMLKAEVGDYSGTNSATDAATVTILSNMQKWLATEYDWPFLERRWNVACPANQQYVTFPTQDDNTDVIDMNLERMPKVEVQWTETWQPVIYGIGADEYNTLDFSLQQQSDPIQRWRAATNPNEPHNPNQYEVWPVPVTNQTMRFTGQRALQPLVNTSTDKADLDDMLLVMACATEMLTRSKQADAGLKQAKFNHRLQFIRQGYPTRDVVRILGGGGDAQFKRDRKLVGARMLIAVH